LRRLDVKRYGPLVILLAAVPLLAFGPNQRVAPTHWALIVGISDYIHFGDEAGGDLPGAERDARGVRDVLIERWEFPEGNIRMLLNHEATQAAITEGMTEWLPAHARPGDQITIFFAGHGSQMWDDSGDEEDGLDETIAPADVRSETTEFDISDDQMGEWLAALPSENVVVALDNCNSGTGTRAVTPFARNRELRRDMSSIPKPASVSRRALPGMADTSGFDSSDGRVLEISAAQPFQSAVDAFFPATDGGEAFYGGAFTTYLVRELWRAPSDLSYEEVFTRVRDALKRNRFEQDPYLSEDVSLKNAFLFSVEGGSTAGSSASLRILGSSRSGSMTELAGGQALGITTGSLFETTEGAQLRVESVSVDRTQVRVMEGRVSEGSRAQLVGFRFPRTILLVGIGGMDSETSSALSAALEGTPGIEMVHGSRDFSHLIVRRQDGELYVIGMDGSLRHTFPAGASSVGELAKVLKMEAAAKQLADMENPAPDFNVKVWLANGQTSFGIGDAVIFHASAGSDGYLTLVDMGTDGTVTVLFPNPFDRDNRVRAGQEIRFPTENMESEIRALPPGGRGMVRAFLTQTPLEIPMNDDFTSGDIFLADLIANAVKESAGEMENAPLAVRLSGWTSASVVYDIRE
jgi:hypothetical protein